MSKSRKKIGYTGEMLALSFLDRKGYIILSKNYACLHGEVDIIAEKDNTICFIEVKTRTSLKYGLPCEAITRSKRRRLILTANTYLRDSGSIDCCCRMDVIEILYLHGGNYIKHIENAFMF